MDIIELTQEPMQKIADLYKRLGLDFDELALQDKLRKMRIVPAEIGAAPISYNARTNVLALDASGLQGYDLKYYLTTYMLLMMNDYCEPLNGIRTAFSASTASDPSLLIGNHLSKQLEGVNDDIDETDDLISGRSLFEPAVKGIQDLNAKIGPDKAIALCTAKSMEEFTNLAREFGIEDINAFLEPYKYLEIHAENSREDRKYDLTEELERNNLALVNEEAALVNEEAKKK